MTDVQPRQCHREFCAICGHVSRVSFWVPDAVWKLAIHVHFQNSIVCLSCFTEHADERSVAWDRDIKFIPTSLVTLLARDLSTIDDVTKAAVKRALYATGKHRAQAAKMLGIGERTLYRLIRKYHLQKFPPKTFAERLGVNESEWY